ncbi:MAG: class I mannose-6-phosphate isomerase [Phycisphaerae bacterium]|nr:class I mannose-6-phosphate isomerase [Phycisphaerae bacterium]
MDVYPLKFTPIYKEKIWGGRNLERLYNRPLPNSMPIGESWELTDLVEGVSIECSGEYEGRTLTDLAQNLGERLLGKTKPMPDGRFPLLLKILDANDILSLQVHPDENAAAKIGGGAAMKTECWYVIESRDGYIYKGLKPGVTPEQFQEAIESDTTEQCVEKIPCKTGDFHYLPAGTVHAIGPGLVIAEVQTPSDTTYRVTDWGRGREIHVENSMESIHFVPSTNKVPGAEGDTLLVTDFFTVARHRAGAGQGVALPGDCCIAIMLLDGTCEIRYDGNTEPVVPVAAGDTVLLPAALEKPTLQASTDVTWLEITLPAN